MSKSESISAPRIKSIMVGFGVKDMARAIDFYTIKLGFKIVFQNGVVFTIVSRDGIEISLALDRSGTGSSKGSCYLKLEGIDVLHEEFITKGVAMTHPLKTESYGMREFMITDPDGNTLNFGEPTSEKNV
jgi:catechol 2,3-dioxygenase-like lactoylglutathione lyase family enzyme